ncbi:peptidase A4 family-domain-containing protein [Boletus reticuloceps]|uniref:Peptidase A4 family-domain-containing protein n=1 Tax=Boletus reticuloceps TaxID=495285 RepID=A0A8I2YEV8_9AGAM|nr:peptidase A4 family-domain-containing protein [Boletus reticuloceps]
MLFKVVPLFLLASTVLAIPSKLGARLARRRANRQSQIINRLEQVDSAISDEQYSNNWAGAVWAEGDNTFTFVTGTFVVPTPSGNNGDSAAAWVGIDGDTCTSAILQTGVDFTVSANGPTYAAWYEFFPAPSADFSGITIAPGDTIKLTVTTSSLHSGTATIDNLTRNEQVSQDLSSTAPLCGQNAEWIVEDYDVNSGLVPFANFGTVTFTDANAGVYTPSGAGIIDIKQNGQVLTSTSIAGSSVTIKHT